MQIRCKQFYSQGMNKSLNQDLSHFARSVSVNGLVVPGAWSEKSGLKHAQTHTEQGLLRTLNIRAKPCRNHEFAFTSTAHNILDSDDMIDFFGLMCSIVAFK